MYDFKGFRSTPRTAIPDLREYSHKSGSTPRPFKICTGSGLDMICRSVIILPLDTLGALPEPKNKLTGGTPRDKNMITGSAPRVSSSGSIITDLQGVPKKRAHV